MLDCASPGGEPKLLEKTILSALEDFEGPIAFGLRSGHVSRQNVTLTFGVEAELDAGDRSGVEDREQGVENRIGTGQRNIFI